MCNFGKDDVDFVINHEYSVRSHETYKFTSKLILTNANILLHKISTKQPNSANGYLRLMKFFDQKLDSYELHKKATSSIIYADSLGEPSISNNTYTIKRVIEG